MATPVQGNDDGPTGYGVQGTSQHGVGAKGASDSDVGVQGVVGSQVPGGVGGAGKPGANPTPISAGVAGYGYHISGRISAATYGVYGTSETGGDGVYGSGSNGVHGEESSGAGPAIDRGAGVFGTSRDNFGVVGTSTNNFGVFGISTNADGVRGVSPTAEHAGVSAINNSPPLDSGVPSAVGLSALSLGTAVFAKGNPAAYFEGNLKVTGDVILLNATGGDVAEDFDVDESLMCVEPGTVLVISSNGRLSESKNSYDTKVAGVVSGAGELNPAIVLQRIATRGPRSPIALVGKTFCKVDALAGAIRPGDLLTTSDTPGHAMKVMDRSQALGAILGKALAPLERGKGLIPILVSLR